MTMKSKKIYANVMLIYVKNIVFFLNLIYVNVMLNVR